jgi:hypothetical protein
MWSNRRSGKTHPHLSGLASSCRSAIVAQARLPRASLPRRGAHVVTNSGFRYLSLAHGSSRADKGSGTLRRDLSLRDVAAELAARGHLNERGKPFNPKSSRSCSLGERSSELGGDALTQVSIAVGGVGVSLYPTAGLPATPQQQPQTPPGTSLNSPPDWLRQYYGGGL